MSSSKAGNGIADNKAMQAVNKAALKAKFPRAKLVKQFEIMAQATGSEATAIKAKRDTAQIVCQLANQYRTDAFGTEDGQTDDVSTILDCWREHWKGLIAELHVADSPFVELGEPNKKGEQKAVMTNYGRNVASTARGVIEHDVAVKDEDDKKRPYTDMVAEIVVARRENLPEDKQTLNGAKATLADSMSAIRKLIGNDPAAILSLATVVDYCSDCFDEHTSEGLLALTLALEEIDLTDYFVEETEEGESDTPPVETSEQAVQIAAA